MVQEKRKKKIRKFKGDKLGNFWTAAFENQIDSIMVQKTAKIRLRSRPNSKESYRINRVKILGVYPKNVLKFANVHEGVHMTEWKKIKKSDDRWKKWFQILLFIFSLYFSFLFSFISFFHLIVEPPERVSRFQIRIFWDTLQLKSWKYLNVLSNKEERRMIEDESIQKWEYPELQNAITHERKCCEWLKNWNLRRWKLQISKRWELKKQASTKVTDAD